MDSQAINAEIVKLNAELDYVKQQVKRLKWLLQQQKNVSLRIPLEWNDPVLSSQWREYRDRLDALLSEQGKRKAEFTTSQQQAKKLAAILPIISLRSANEKSLVNKKLFPKQQYLETEQQRLTIQYDLKSQQSRVQELRQTLAEIKAQINHARSNFAKTSLEKSEEFEQRMINIQQELIKARSRKKAYYLIAPTAGKVQQLVVHTPGAIVMPAQELMRIVPKSVELEIEAYVENKDIGFVYQGQKVTIKLDAFPFTKYGTLEGEIVDISDDAITDEDKGLIYKARVSLKQSMIQVEDKWIKLGSGMAASVEIKTGQRRLIEFF